MEETPRHLLEHDRQRDRDLEQEDWERDPEHKLMFAKPPRRYRATKDEWINFHEWRAEQPCWICGGRSTNTHHIYPRGQGGDDRLENFAALCGSGTTGCHGRIEARDPVARARLRLALRDENLLYLSAKLGVEHARAWLDRNYPPPGAFACEVPEWA